MRGEIGYAEVLLHPPQLLESPHLEEREAELFLENLRRYMAGEPLLNVVDKKASYWVRPSK